ncbi:MAG: T9SS type A sorting domain-containing protein [Bacteroidetes bacterium]|nr:T9SS type A sorting domain-containing protein [Bacteroidota bacterium]
MKANFNSINSKFTSMKKIYTTLTTTFIVPAILCATTFYIDPINGSMSNNGAYNSPWSKLEAVVNSNLIESYANSPLPYNAQTNQPSIKNLGAPIKSGDTLLLRTGLHGEVFLQNYNNLSNITVMADAGHHPILERLQLQACKNWRFDGLAISTEPYGYYLHGRLVYLETHGWQGPTSHIDIHNCEIYSTESPWTTANDWVTKVSDGIYIKTDSVNIINNLVRNIGFGISAVGDHIKVIGNEVRNFSGDGMRILGSYGLFEHNLIKNCYDVDDNHDDGIQSFTTNGYVVDHNIVRSNIILNYDDPNQPLLGPLQGIGCFDGFYNDWTVENNLIVVNHWHGITFLGANDCRIINNTVLDPTPDITPGPSWIRIDDHKDGTPSSNCFVSNNVANQFVVDGIVSHNMTLSNFAAYQANFVDYTVYDFHLKANSSLIDQADNASAPAMDMDGTPRPQGLNADIGCYEYAAMPSDVRDSDLDVEINIYPNPAAQICQISTPAEFKNGKVEIINLTGIILKMAVIESDITTINMDDLLPGIYFVKLTSRDKRFFIQRKLVKK